MHLTFTKKKYYNTKPRRNGSPCKNKRIYGESVQDQQKAIKGRQLLGNVEDKPEPLIQEVREAMKKLKSGKYRDMMKYGKAVESIRRSRHQTDA